MEHFINQLPMIVRYIKQREDIIKSKTTREQKRLKFRYDWVMRNYEKYHKE